MRSTARFVGPGGATGVDLAPSKWAPTCAPGLCPRASAGRPGAPRVRGRLGPAGTALRRIENHALGRFWPTGRVDATTSATTTIGGIAARNGWVVSGPRAPRGLPGRPRREVPTGWADAAEPKTRRPRAAAESRATYDLLTLSNLCVDVLVRVPELPPAKGGELLARLERSASSPDGSWEAGGNSNVLLSAARLGLTACALGVLGADIPGAFLTGILNEEGVEVLPLRDANEGIADCGPSAGESFRTLRCYVLLDPHGQHAFCSRYDIGPWPLLGRALPAPSARAALRATRSLFVNGFCFDDLPADEVLSSVAVSKNAGASIIFDPGPRAATFQVGERREALDGALQAADVVSLTEEEALDIVGTADAHKAAAAILDRSACDWCVVKCGARGALLVTRDGRVVDCPAFPVKVADTVGCGDSLAAALALARSRCEPREIEAAMALACAVGAASATRRGAGRAVAGRADVRAILGAAIAAGRPDARGALELLDRVVAERGTPSSLKAARTDATAPPAAAVIAAASSRECSEPCTGGGGFMRA